MKSRRAPRDASFAFLSLILSASPHPSTCIAYLFSLLVSWFVNITCRETSVEFMFGLAVA